MSSCLVIVGARAHVLTGFMPTKTYQCVYLGARPPNTSHTLQHPNTVCFDYDLSDTEFDFDSLCANLSGFSSIDILFAAYTDQGLDITDPVTDIHGALLCNCLQPLLLFSALSQNLPEAKLSGVFISSMYAHLVPYPPNYAIDSKINPLYYGVSKAGVEQGVKWLSAQRPNHCFNSIALGPMPKPSVFEQSPHLIQSLYGHLPSGQFVAHAELHNLINYIFENSPGSLRGGTVHLDGGYGLW